MDGGLDLEAQRRELVAERARLLEELGEPIEGPGQMTYGSQAAAATHVFEQQRDLALRDHARAQLAQVDAALASLDAGSYGVCHRCGGAIAAARLEAIPWVQLCIDCARSPR
ncbi:MAG TPA: TraR/DksA family transcriptional regulator [Candidatus Limnocylindrales bacterium]|nr:TraR/DksA family transcriptional regulator [Candidatus Limnocylindrales bacterium]